MSRLGAARARILESLVIGGVRAGTSGRFSAPAVILEAAEPWSVPARMPGRDSRWQLTAVAGSGDADTALEEIADLIDRCDVALRRLDGCGLPTWSKPRDSVVGDITLPTCVGSFTYALEL
jgi:hypothetical protein